MIDLVYSWKSVFVKINTEIRGYVKRISDDKENTQMSIN